MTAKDAIDRIRALVGDDKTPYRYPDTELFLWLADGQRQIVSMRPDAAYITAVTIPASYTVASLTASLVVSDAFLDALVDFVCSRALGRDAEHAENGKLADTYRESFVQKVSVS